MNHFCCHFHCHLKFFGPRKRWREIGHCPWWHHKVPSFRPLCSVKPSMATDQVSVLSLSAADWIRPKFGLLLLLLHRLLQCWKAASLVDEVSERIHLTSRLHTCRKCIRQFETTLYWSKLQISLCVLCCQTAGRRCCPCIKCCFTCSAAASRWSLRRSWPTCCSGRS